MRRERHNFFNKRTAHFVDPNWSRLCETKNRLPSSRLESQLTVLFQIPKSLVLPGMTSFMSLVTFPLWGFYCDISDCHIRSACAWTPALNVCTMHSCPRGVMVKAMHCGIVVREFVLQSRYYVHFRANTLGKGMNPLILPPAMGK